MRLKALSVASEPLERAAKVVDFKLFRTELEATLAPSDRSKGAPYVFASNVDDERVADLIERIAAGAVDVIAFTSASQIRRLWDVVRYCQIEAPCGGVSRTRS